MDRLDKEWFEFKDLTKRKFENAVWIPVYGNKYLYREGEYPEIGFVQELLAVRTAAIFRPHIHDVENLDWSDFSNDGCQYRIDTEGRYFEASSFLSDSYKEIGFRLILSLYLNSHHPRLITINQDFVYALGLIEEDGKWLRPSDGYEEVIRVQRDRAEGSAFVEVRSEYLKDYLSARDAALRLYCFRRREAVVAKDPKFDWPQDFLLDNEKHNRREVRNSRINRNGDAPGSGWAIFRAWRTDVDPEEDVPDFSSGDDEATSSSSEHGSSTGEGIRHHVVGELWRGEWVQPAEKSVRLGFDEPDEEFFVSADGGGVKVNLKSLSHEEVGKYLWFDPNLINHLLERRESGIKWYTDETGLISGGPDGGVHFGVNKLGLINAYAYDVATRPLWERRIWVANNLRPDGGVSAELLQSQIECRPANSVSPELLLPDAVDWLQRCFQDRFGSSVFRGHAELGNLQARIHRFRALKENDLRALGKDIVRFTIDRLDKHVLQAASGIGSATKLGTLKLLECVLANATDSEFAAKHMAPLFGAYDLRIADAHLATSDVASIYSTIGIERSLPFVWQGAMLIRIVANTIGVIGTGIKDHAERVAKD